MKTEVSRMAVASRSKQRVILNLFTYVNLRFQDDTLFCGSFMFVLLSMLLAVSACGPGAASEGKEEVVVFAAASLRDVLEEIGDQFEAETGVSVLFNFAGSNVLAQQIVATPGADLFLSASARWMDTVEEANRLTAETRHALISNSLALIAHPNTTFTLADPCELASFDFKYLALGNPDAVPAGRYARTWLTTQTCGEGTLWEALEARVAPAPDVRSALGLVVADPGLLGIVYKTDWMAFAEEARLLYEVPRETAPPIRYDLAQVAGGPNPTGAVRLHAYLRGSAARPIFERHGFRMLPES